MNLTNKLAWILLLKYGKFREQQCLRTYIDAVFYTWIRRQTWWPVRKPTTVKKIRCPSAPPRIPNSRKNAVILKNQVMNIAACILFLTPTAIALMPRCSLTSKNVWSIRGEPENDAVNTPAIDGESNKRHTAEIIRSSKTKHENDQNDHFRVSMNERWPFLPLYSRILSTGF